MDAGWTSSANHDYIAYLRETAVEGVGKDTPVQPQLNRNTADLLLTLSLQTHTQRMHGYTYT